MDVDAFVAASDAYPIPTSPDGAPIRFSYGTAGFRTRGDVLASTVFRCGAVAAVRSAVTGRATGIVVTASHNPERDNGVKLVDCDGGMLPVAWERHAEALANAPGWETMRAAIATMRERPPRRTSRSTRIPAHAADPPPPHVFLARDTRPTGPALAAAAKAGAEAIGASVTDLGLMTTPQLHYRVRVAPRMAERRGGLLREARARVPSHGRRGPRSLVRERRRTTVHRRGLRQRRGRREARRPRGSRRRTDLAKRLVDGPSQRRRGAGVAERAGGRGFRAEGEARAAHGGFDTLGPSRRCVSVDGDADRLVYFRLKNDDNDGSAELLDGDKIAALVATRVTDLLERCAPVNAFDPPLRVGVVQTAYANGASTAYVRDVLGVECACANTGVKFLHPVAETFDVGVYFEANGHGTAVFSDATIERLDAAIERLDAGADGGPVGSAEHSTDAVAALRELKAMTEAINPAVGDALSGILVVEAVLLAKGWGLTEWGNMYADLPSRQVKVTVRDRSVITVTDAERVAVTPDGMQAAVDEAVGRHGAHARAFARPSGTEDVVRVYAEAATEAGAAELAREVCGIVYDFAGGIGDRP